MTEIDNAWKALNKNGFALDYDEDSRPGALAKAIDYALAAKDDEIGRRDERISELEAQVERTTAALSHLAAMVRGECPSLLNEDSGGDGRLSVEIDDILAVTSTELQGDRNG